jgi:hypothetical protein
MFAAGTLLALSVLASEHEPPELQPDATTSETTETPPGETPASSSPDATTETSTTPEPSVTPTPAVAEPATPPPADAELPPARPQAVESERPPPPTGSPLSTGRRRVLESSTRPWFIHAAVGGDRPIYNIEYGAPQLGSLHLEEAIGGHFSGGEGAAMAFVLQQTLDPEVYTYAFAARFVYDAPIHPELGIYLSPSFTIGYRRVREGGIDGSGDTGNDECPPFPPEVCGTEVHHQATMQLGLAILFVIADRLPLFIRPIVLDVAAPHVDENGQPPIALRWHILAGLGVTF